MIRFDNITIDRTERRISNGGKSYQWMQETNGHRTRYVCFRLIQHLLLGGGMTTKEIFDAIYSDNEDGGPLYGQKVITVLLTQIKPRLRELDLELKIYRHNSYCIYKAVPAHVA